MACVLCRNINSWYERHVFFDNRYIKAKWIERLFKSWKQATYSCTSKAKDFVDEIFDRGDSCLGISLTNLIFHFTSTSTAPFVECQPTPLNYSCVGLGQRRYYRPTLFQRLSTQYRGLKTVRLIITKIRKTHLQSSVHFKSGYTKFFSIER